MPLHGHRISESGLKALVWLAARLKANLMGLVIENQTLFEAAELPFTTEVSVATGEERELFSEPLRRRHSRLPGMLEDLFKRLTAQSGVAFKLVFSAQDGYRFDDGATIAQTLLDLRRDVYFPAARTTRGADSRMGGPSAETWYRRVKLFYDASPAAERAIQTLHALVGSDKTTDIVLVSEGNLALALLESLSGRGTRVAVQHLSGEIGPAVQTALRHPSCELLILPAPLARRVPPNRFDEWVFRGPTPVLVSNV